MAKSNLDEKLNSITETVVVIPFGSSDVESDSEDELETMTQTPSTSFPCKMFTPPELTYRDLPDGPYLRMKAYEDAHKQLRTRFQTLLGRMNKQIVHHVTNIVHEAYVPREEERLMPYTELRVVTISGADRGITANVLQEVRKMLLVSSLDKPQSVSYTRSSVLVSTLVSSECNNLTNAMKALISGFLRSDIELEEDPEETPRRVLASYDINELVFWYERVKRSYSAERSPKLVVLVDDLERIDTTIMQDIFYICSLHIPQLPLIFVMGLSTSPASTYFMTTYTRTTRALLRASHVEVSSGVEVLEKLLLDTFFSLTFEPPIMLNPSAISFIFDQFSRNTQSIDFAVSLIQLILLRHFADPMSVLAVNELLGTNSMTETAEKLAESGSRPFLCALLARLNKPEAVTGDIVVGETEVDPEVNDASPSRRSRRKGKEKAHGPSPTNGKFWHGTTTLELLKHINELREEHSEQVQRSRLAFWITLEIRGHLLAAGVLKSSTERGPARDRDNTIRDYMCACIRGTLTGREGKNLANGIRRLKRENLSALVTSLTALTSSINSHRDKLEITEHLGQWRSRLDQVSQDEDEDSLEDIANEFIDWLLTYMSESMRDYTETKLWDLWYTGNPQGISELLNPAPRLSIINALVHPERYLDYKTDPPSHLQNTSPQKGKDDTSVKDGVVEEDVIVDTSVLFRLYMESGRMVNVYDWYAAFKEALEGRRRAAHEKKKKRNREKRKSRRASPTPSPRKKASARQGVSHTSEIKRGRGRERGRGVKKTGPGIEPEEDEAGRRAAEVDVGETSSEEESDLENPEHWETEVVARFIRGVQELDMLGFVRHTGRKAEHIHKTVYEPAEM